MAASVFSRVLSWLVSFVIGAAFGLAATVGHASVPPVGLIVGALGCAGMLLALRMLADDRVTVIAAGIGMFAALLVLSQRGPGGSVLVPATVLANVWMLLLGVIILLVVVTPDFRKLRATSAAQSVSTTVPEVAPRWQDPTPRG